MAIVLWLSSASYPHERGPHQETATSQTVLLGGMRKLHGEGGE